MKKRIIGLLTAVSELASTFAPLAFTVFGSGGSNSDADGAVLDTAYNAAAQKLDDDYGYTEYDLGTALIDTSYGGTMRFRLWSPTAEGVKLNIFTTGTNYEPGATRIGSYTLEKLHAVVVGEVYARLLGRGNIVGDEARRLRGVGGVVPQAVVVKRYGERIKLVGDGRPVVVQVSGDGGERPRIVGGGQQGYGALRLLLLGHSPALGKAVGGACSHTRDDEPAARSALQPLKGGRIRVAFTREHVGVRAYRRAYAVKADGGERIVLPVLFIAYDRLQAVSAVGLKAAALHRLRVGEHADGDKALILLLRIGLHRVEPHRGKALLTAARGVLARVGIIAVA